MTMTPDELRALADALDGCNPYRDSSAVYSVAAYLRAQADAQPVAWLRPENRVEEECTARTRISIGERCPPIGTWRPLYTRPAPSAPQAEPKREPLSDEPPRGFVRWVRNNMPPNTVISNPDWWAMQLWRAAMRAHRIGGSDAE